MSNPGVIVLSEATVQKRVPVRIEDNIGECVHIHVGTFRVDLTINQFILLADNCNIMLDEFLKKFELSSDELSPKFLDDIASKLIDIQSIKKEPAILTDLLVESRNVLGMPKIVPLSEGSIVQAFNGKTKKYKKIRKLNEQQVFKRLSYIRKLELEGEYGKTGELIVLFNDQNIIRDGQHRASYLYNAGKRDDVEVLRIQFIDSKHSISNPLFLAYTFNWPRNRIIKKVVKIRALFLWIKRRIRGKFGLILNSILN